LKSLLAGLNNRSIGLPAHMTPVAASMPCPLYPQISMVQVVDRLLPDSQLFPVWSPFPDGYITGWTQVGINSDGTASFRGHFHDSGPSAYDYVVVTALLDVVDANGNTLVFAHKGTIHGTFEFGSRDDNWQTDSVSCLIASNWAAARSSRTYSTIHTHNDVAGVLETIIEGMLSGLGIVGIVLFGDGVATGKISCQWADPSTGGGLICSW
jgi:hypothetical protein